MAAPVLIPKTRPSPFARLLQVALELVALAFCLEAFVSNQHASCFLDRARLFRLTRSAGERCTWAHSLIH